MKTYRWLVMDGGFIIDRKLLVPLRFLTFRSAIVASIKTDGV